MKIERLQFAGYTLLAAMLASAPAMAQQTSGKLYNTAKQKLLDGKQIFSVTISKPDVAAYCEAAKHYDYTWFEMQHSTLTWADIEKMVAACPHSVATPMVRIQDELESSIQHATDIGMLGIIMPTVDTVEKAQAAVKYAKYPPEGRRSMGAGQAASLWVGKSADDRMKYRTSDQRKHDGGGDDRNAHWSRPRCGDRECAGRRCGAGRQYRSGQFLRLVRPHVRTVPGHG